MNNAILVHKQKLGLSGKSIWTMLVFCILLINIKYKSIAQQAIDKFQYPQEKLIDSIICRNYILNKSKIIFQADSIIFIDFTFKNIKFQINNKYQIAESILYQGELKYLGLKIANSGFIIKQAGRDNNYHLQVFSDVAFWQNFYTQNIRNPDNISDHNSFNYAINESESKNLLAKYSQDVPDSLSIEKVWIWQNGVLTPVWQLRKSFVESLKKSATYYLSLDGKDTLLELPLNVYNHNHRPPVRYPVRPPDTLARFWIFMPDPLTSAQTIYGATGFVDNNDTDSPELTSQRSIKNGIVYKYNGLYKLENDKVRIAEFDPPIQTICNSTQPNFNFTRSNDCFEQANAFWHLSNYINKISGIGFDMLTWPQIEADAGALNNADQSMYSPMLDKLYFGQGNVDDAEDADVIIHEYTHALLNRAASFTNIGFERRTLEEGNCDYMAADYSAKISNFNSNIVYNWDGNNVFWQGRRVVTTKNYLSGRIGNIYTDGEIWSSTIMQIRNGLGSSLTNQLLLYSWFGYYPNMRMENAAHLFLQADTLLNNAQNSAFILQFFVNRRILNSTSAYKKYNAFDVEIINHLTPGSLLPIYLHSNHGPISAVLINSVGQQIHKYPECQMLEIPTNHIKPGIYWLDIHQKNYAKRIKIIR